MLTDFKACRIGHPDFEIQFLDFIPSDVIEIALLSRNAFDYYFYIAKKNFSYKTAYSHIPFYPPLKRSAVHIFVKKIILDCMPLNTAQSKRDVLGMI